MPPRVIHIPDPYNWTTLFLYLDRTVGAPIKVRVVGVVGGSNHDMPVIVPIEGINLIAPSTQIGQRCALDLVNQRGQQVADDRKVVMDTDKCLDLFGRDWPPNGIESDTKRTTVCIYLSDPVTTSLIESSAELRLGVPYRFRSQKRFFCCPQVVPVVAHEFPMSRQRRKQLPQRRRLIASSGVPGLYN